MITIYYCLKKNSDAFAPPLPSLCKKIFPLTNLCLCVQELQLQLREKSKENICTVSQVDKFK